MPISSTDIAGLPDYTDAELLKMYRWALINNAAGQTRSISGRTVQFPTADEIRKTIQWLEDRVAAASNAVGGNMALGAFEDPV
jgi:hypothetical protein